MIPDSLYPVANHLWQSTIFAGVAGLLTLALRSNSARLRYGVWMIASVKFLIPFYLFVALGSNFGLRSMPATRPPAMTVVIDEISQTFTPVVQSAPVHVPAGPALSRVLAILTVVWALGLIVIGAFRWFRWMRVKAVVRAGSPVQFKAGVPIISSPPVLEPGVFGFFRPVLLLPKGITDRLTPEQLDAIVEHELCHVRRCDNLTAAFHMLVEAIFWFHPLVWWIWTKLAEERERACDEEVLRLGSEPGVYARGILRVCESCLESSLECVAGVTGANLKRRIEQIMKRRIIEELTGGKKLLLAAAGVFAITGPFVMGLMNALPARAQATRSADTPGFEVSAVRPCSPADPSGRSSEPIGHGTLKVSCMTVIDFIQSAYVNWANGHLNSPKWLRIEGGPAWIKSERYTINAKSQADAPFEMLTGPMLQLLLEDRFKLKTHREIREIPVYALTVSKSGPKLKPVPEGSCTPSDQFTVEKFLAMSAPDQKLPDLCGTTKGGPSPSGNGFAIARDFHGMTMAQFGRALPVDRPVTDKTGIVGMFDFHLEFALDDTTRSVVPPNSPAALASDPGGPSIFTALREQLGLKLEPAKGPGEFLVIDSVERPSGN